MLFNEANESEVVETSNNILLEQYNIYLTSIDRVTQYRIESNRFFLGLNTTIGGGITFLLNSKDNVNIVFLFVTFILGIIVSFYWKSVLENYAKLNAGKFQVLIEIEKKLPLNLFDYEWTILGRGQNSKLYKKSSFLESLLPTTFISVYSLLFLFLLIIELNNHLNIIE